MWNAFRTRHRPTSSGRPIERAAAEYDADLTLNLSTETLESREMLAGQVHVSVVGDNLILRGDVADNTVIVFVNAPDHRVYVQGADSTALVGDATSNLYNTGIPEGSLNNLAIRLRGGNDTVRFLNVEVGNNLKVNTGTGIDTVTFSATASFECRIHGTTTMKTGAGADIVDINRVTFHDRFKLNTGSGSDHVWIGSATSASNFINFHGSILVKLGSADDSLAIDLFDTLGSSTLTATIKGGAGTDVLDATPDLTETQWNAAGNKVSKIEVFM